MIRVPEPKWPTHPNALDLVDGWSDSAVAVWWRLLAWSSLYGIHVFDAETFGRATGRRPGVCKRTLGELSVHGAVSLHRGSDREAMTVAVWAWNGTGWVQPQTGAPKPPLRGDGISRAREEFEAKRRAREQRKKARELEKARLRPKNEVDGEAALDSMRPFSASERVLLCRFRKAGLAGQEIALRLLATRTKRAHTHTAEHYAKKSNDASRVNVNTHTFIEATVNTPLRARGESQPSVSVNVNTAPRVNALLTLTKESEARQTSESPASQSVNGREERKQFSSSSRRPLDLEAIQAELEEILEAEERSEDCYAHARPVSLSLPRDPRELDPPQDQILSLSQPEPSARTHTSAITRAEPEAEALTPDEPGMPPGLSEAGKRKWIKCGSSPFLHQVGFTWAATVSAVEGKSVSPPCKPMDRETLRMLAFSTTGAEATTDEILAQLAAIIREYAEKTPRDKWHPMSPSAIAGWHSRGRHDERAQAEAARLERMTAAERREHHRATWRDPVADAYHADALDELDRFRAEQAATNARRIA